MNRELFIKDILAATIAWFGIFGGCAMAIVFAVAMLGGK